MPFSGLVTYADPLRAGRHPFETFLLALCAFSGIPLLFGQANSGSIESTLPTGVGMAWGLILCAGAGVALLGTFWPVRDDHRGPGARETALRDQLTAARREADAYATALMLERIGLALVGPGAFVYAGVIVIAAGLGGLAVASITAGFGWAAIARMRHVARVFRRALEIRGGGR